MRYSLCLLRFPIPSFALSSLPPHPLPLPSEERGRVRGAVLYALCAMLLFSIFGCQGSLLQLKPVLENEGEVYLYAQPFPQEADRLRFSIETISAVTSDGREFPLVLSMKNIKCRELKRQRLFASGSLPPGLYSGLSFKVKSAFLKTEDEEAALLVLDTPVKLDFPFSVVRKRGYVISMTFRYNESVRGGFSFTPGFSFLIPPKPIIALTGYVSNSSSNNVTVFDKKTNQVMGVIPTGRNPLGMALDQGRNRAYVALSADDSIEVIDISLAEVVDRLKLNIGDRPRELALTPDGRFLLCVNTGSNTVSFIDPGFLREVGRVNVGKNPNSILIDQTGRRGFVFNTLSNTFSVIDIPNRGIIGTISTEFAPLRGQFNRRGDKLYVIQDGSSNLLEFDAAFLNLLRRDKVKFGENSIKVDNKTDYVYLGRKRDVTVEVYEPFMFSVIYYIDTGGDIEYMTIDGEQYYLYLVNSGRKTTMVVNLVSKKVIAEFDVGEGPYWVTMMGER
jgi:YVTN family beta-propeller protein